MLCTLRFVPYFSRGVTQIQVRPTILQVFEEYQGFLEKYGDLRYCMFQCISRKQSVHYSFNSVIPTRYFLGRPDIGEEMHISIEKGKTLIIRLMAVGPVVEGRAQRDVWFEVNGEVSYFMSIRGFSSRCIIRSVPCRSKTRVLQSKQFPVKRPLPTLDRSEHLCLVSW